MNTDKEIKKLERKIAALKAKSLKSEAKRKKTALSRVLAVVKKFGFDTIQELLEIADTTAVVTATTRKRAKVTNPLRKSVIATLKTGKTASVVSKMHKISTATVNNIKKAAGLTNSKKPKKVGPIHIIKYNPKQRLRRAVPKTTKKVTAPKAADVPAETPTPKTE
jgi:hypothetical protein